MYTLDKNLHLIERQMKWHNEMIYENTVTGSDVIYMVLVSIILQDPYIVCPQLTQVSLALDTLL